MRRQKAGLFDHALMAAVVGFVIGALWVADAYSQSYTTFPNLRSGNVDFTATIRANGSACASGTAIVSGGGTVTCTAVVPTSQKGAANGVASLDGSGKVPTSQLPFSGLTYDGSWNATTNSPTLADGTGTSGHFYITSVAGTQNLGSGSITFAVGDWALYNGTVWQKVPSSAAVSSVFGRTGAVTATAGDYTATQVTNTPAGGIAATTAQAAINELDTEKQAAASTLTSWAALTRASGFDTFTQTPSSANLRGLLTDEVGTGAAYFVGGALGTPASATLTNGTGLPWSTGLTGVPTTAAGYGITGGAKLDAYAGGDTPSAFTLGIVDSVDAATWRAAIGAGTSSATGTVTSVSGSGGSTGLTLTGGPITTSGTLTLGGTLADGSLSSNVPLKNAANTFTDLQSISLTGTNEALRLQTNSTSPFLSFYLNGTGRESYVNSDNAAGFLFVQEKNKPLALYTNNTQREVISGAGNVTINAPSSGTPLSVNGAAGAGTFIAVSNGTVSGGLAVSSTPNLQLGTSTSHGVDFYTAGSTRASIASAGNVTINSPSSGIPLSVTSPASGTPLSLTDGTVTGQISMSGGAVSVGATSAHSLQLMANSGSIRATILNGIQVGSPTGGDQGVGTINAASDLKVNNVSVCRSDGTNCPSGAGFTLKRATMSANGSSCTVGVNAGVSSCTRNSTGNYTVTFGSAFSANATCTVSVAAATGGAVYGIAPTGSVTSAATFSFYEHTDTPIEASNWTFICIGP